MRAFYHEKSDDQIVQPTDPSSDIGSQVGQLELGAGEFLIWAKMRVWVSTGANNLVEVVNGRASLRFAGAVDSYDIKLLEHETQNVQYISLMLAVKNPKPTPTKDSSGLSGLNFKTQARLYLKNSAETEIHVNMCKIIALSADIIN